MLPLFHRPGVSGANDSPRGLWSVSGFLRLLFVLSCVPAVLLAALAAVIVMPFAFLFGHWPRRLPRPPSRPPRGPASPVTHALPRSGLNRFHGLREHPDPTAALERPSTTGRTAKRSALFVFPGRRAQAPGAVILTA